MTGEIEIERKWAMPNKDTFMIKPIKGFVIECLRIKTTFEPFLGKTIDPFVGSDCIEKYFSDFISNDLNPNIKANCHKDALVFLKQFPSEYANCVLFDPPYSNRQISKAYKGVGLDTQNGELTRSSYYSNLKNEVSRITKPNGKVLCFGWNSQGIGITRGFRLRKILLVVHGGAHNDTICTFEVKRVGFQAGATK